MIERLLLRGGADWMVGGGRRMLSSLRLSIGRIDGEKRGMSMEIYD